MLGKGFARRSPALERLDRLRSRRRFLRCQFILGCGGLQVFQLQFHLFEKPRRAFRAAAVEFAPQLLDLEFQMGDQRFMAGEVRLSGGRLGFGARRNGFRFHSRGALREDHRVGGSKIGRKRFRRGFHKAMESHPSPPASQIHHPTDVGRQLSCGWRQSIPDSR
jgi:hypothetical protein